MVRVDEPAPSGGHPTRRISRARFRASCWSSLDLFLSLMRWIIYLFKGKFKFVYFLTLI